MNLRLESRDTADLAGAHGEGARWAMGLIVALAEAFGAERLVDIDQAHLVGAYHSGPANLDLLDRLNSAGARVRVPTTLSASSADLSQTAPSCYADGHAAAARAVVERALALGCTPALTCAPYFLATAPRRGQVVAWAESNAAIFANSVIGAKSLKTPQYLDLACALTGRAPLIGPLIDAGRAPQLYVDISALSPAWFATSLGPELLGHVVGEVAGVLNPFISRPPRPLDVLALRSVCAGAGVTSGFALLHIEGITPEADNWADTARSLPAERLVDHDLHSLLSRFEVTEGDPVGAVFLGAPHFGPEDLNRLAALLNTPMKVPLLVSVSRGGTFESAILNRLDAAGVTLVHDTCTYYGPPAENIAGVPVTNSVKWAAYATNRGFRPHLTSLVGAVEAARTGRVPAPIWITP
ncbi:aconitase X [Synechococcus sp. BA-132 BA5]|uniref:aconitase X n=1 Tax=Synechococcus sp. BA-132 BA5 TaxID=3110252 RepID=UPI002B1FC487|nr:aconitase X [Synechococcus sp. BA-132 BA5]MEA5417224.1 aconitase X [Synechococcus sp. BA-132 BA5]